MAEVQIKIGGMTCIDCARHLTGALEHVDGVQAASIDYRAGTGRVELVPAVIADATVNAALVKAVERAGYHAEVIDIPNATPTNPSRPINILGTGRSDTPSPVGELPTGQSIIHTPRDRVADFDMLIIGTGGAGVAAAIQASGMGATVGIVEAGALGGTCVNVGCIPSKTLLEAAAHVHAARRGFPGVAPCTPVVEWREVIRQKDALVDELRGAKYADVLASYPAIVRLEGRAQFLTSASGIVHVRIGDQEHTARKVVVATGSAPSIPAIPGLDTVDALDSTSAMTLDALPASMLVLGGGPVGVELGQMFARFGVKVVIVQRGAHLLPAEDPEIAQVLREALEAEGIEVHTGTAAVRVEAAGNEVIVHVNQGSLAGELRAARLLIASGRHPNTRALGLEAVGVSLSPTGFVQVNAMLQTTNPDVYAAGDVTGGPAYVYVAAAGGRIAAENAINDLRATGRESSELRELDLSVVPSVTFTMPQVGSVGLTEHAARAAGMHIDVSVLDMKHVPRALVSYDQRGLVKLVTEAGSGRIIGVQAVATNAGEFMGEAALAVRFGLTARDISGTLHPYLTWGESLKLTAQGGSAGVAKLSCCA